MNTLQIIELIGNAILLVASIFAAINFIYSLWSGEFGMALAYAFIGKYLVILEFFGWLWNWAQENKGKVSIRMSLCNYCVSLRNWAGKKLEARNEYSESDAAWARYFEAAEGSEEQAEAWRNLPVSA